MTKGLAGVLGRGATYRGDLVFQGRVRVEGILVGAVSSDDLLEIGPTGKVQGEIDVAQALIAGEVDGVLRVRERCTLLESAIVRGRVITPWIDVRMGAQLRAELIVDRRETEPP